MMFARALRNTFINASVVPTGFYAARIAHPKLSKEAIEETLAELQTLMLETDIEAHQLGMSHEHKLMNIVREVPGSEQIPTVIFKVLSPAEVPRTNLEGGVSLPAGTKIQPKIVNPTGANTLYQVPETQSISARAAAGQGESAQAAGSAMKTIYPRKT